MQPVQRVAHIVRYLWRARQYAYGPVRRDFIARNAQAVPLRYPKSAVQISLREASAGGHQSAPEQFGQMGRLGSDQ
jgi:hypothetical protein